MEEHAGRGGPEGWLNPDLFGLSGDEPSWPFQEGAQPGVTLAVGRQPEAITVCSKLLDTRVAVSGAYYGSVIEEGLIFRMFKPTVEGHLCGVNSQPLSCRTSYWWLPAWGTLQEQHRQGSRVPRTLCRCHMTWEGSVPAARRKSVQALIAVRSFILQAATQVIPLGLQGSSHKVHRQWLALCVPLGSQSKRRTH